METILQLRDVGLEYSVRTSLFKTFRHTALRNISFDIKRGETLGVLGKNGSGKSTLLQILAGLIEPSSGEILLPAEPLTRSLLTLGLGFRPDLTGQDNAIVSLVLQGKSKKEAEALLPGIYEFSELGEFFQQPVKTYSAGMRARLGFATATQSEVDVLLIDEVLSVGDIQFRHKAEQLMLNRMGGHQTVILVSQSPRQIRTLCDEAIWIHDSEIHEIGAPDKVAKAYLDFMNVSESATTS